MVHTCCLLCLFLWVSPAVTASPYGKSSDFQWSCCYLWRDTLCHYKTTRTPQLEALKPDLTRSLVCVLNNNFFLSCQFVPYLCLFMNGQCVSIKILLILYKFYVCILFFCVNKLIFFPSPKMFEICLVIIAW